MKYLSIVMPLLGALLFNTAAIADEGRHHMDKGMKMSGDKKEHYRNMMKEHHQMNVDMMKMMRATMSILKGLNHKPSADEKDRLGKMIDRVDEMMASQKEMREKAMKMHKEKRDGMMDHHKNPCASKGVM